MGKKVVLGGIHPSILPEEAGQHADAIVIGRQRVYGPVYRDFKANKLRRIPSKCAPGWLTYRSPDVTFSLKVRIISLIQLFPPGAVPIPVHFALSLGSSVTPIAAVRYQKLST